MAGRWHGPAPLHVECALTILGASTYLLGHDDVARIEVADATNAALQIALRGLFFNPFGADPFALFSGPLTLRVLIQNAATGATSSSTAHTFTPLQNPSGFGGLQNAPTVTRTVPLPALAAGSHIVWCRVESVSATLVLPPDYFAVTGYSSVATMPPQYLYQEGDGPILVWDWLRDVGLRPANPAQLALDGTAIAEAHQAAVLAGTLEHRGEWTQFIRNGASHSCDWSALRVVVSGDEEAEWEAPEFLLPAPHPALFDGPPGGELLPTYLGPLARSVSASSPESASTCLVAGSIATSQGPALALWRLEEGEVIGIDVELLGTHPNDNQFFCEMALLNNFASDILRKTRDDGEVEIYVLSFGRLHRFDPNADDIRRALPGVPAATDGHPGGRCLREHPSEGALKYFTEGFLQNTTQDGEVFFYNRLVEYGLGARRIHAGTSFHGHNCAEVAWGDLLGITMNAPYGDADTQAFIAALRGGRWERWGLDSFPASKYLWQRLRAVGTREGLRLLVCGRDRESEEAIWAVDDGRELRESYLPFRPRRLTRTTWGNSGEAVLCVGRAVTGSGGAAEVASTWSVIAVGDLDGDGSVFVKKCLFWDDTLHAFEISKAALIGAGFDLAKLPAFLWWDIDLQQNGGGVWLQRDVAPTDGRPYLVKGIISLIVLYSLPLNQALPYDSEAYSRLCFTLHEDGGTGTDAIEPGSGAGNAQEALDLMPDGTEPILIRKGCGDTIWSSIQVSDVSELASDLPLRRLARARLDWPLLWTRVDSEAASDDLATYTQLMRFDTLQALSREAQAQVDVCVLAPPGLGKIMVPVVEKRT